METKAESRSAQRFRFSDHGSSRRSFAYFAAYTPRALEQQATIEQVPVTSHPNPSLSTLISFRAPRKQPSLRAGAKARFHAQPPAPSFAPGEASSGRLRESNALEIC